MNGNLDKRAAELMSHRGRGKTLLNAFQASQSLEIFPCELGSHWHQAGGQEWRWKRGTETGNCMQSRGEEWESHTVGDTYCKPSPQEAEAGAWIQVQTGLCRKILALKQTTTKKDGWVWVRDEGSEESRTEQFRGPGRGRHQYCMAGSPFCLHVP